MTLTYMTSRCVTDHENGILEPAWDEMERDMVPADPAPDPLLYSNTDHPELLHNHLSNHCATLYESWLG